jgi:DNA helicase II / ATP-dependent DNA helicase PcrA
MMMNLCLRIATIRKANKGKYTYEFILVDEHQDSNLAQQMILNELCESGNIFCLQDYRQCIYSFRGSDPEYAMNFEKYWKNPTFINLYVNYRSTNNIVNKANDFIRPYYANYEHYMDAEAHNKKNGEIKVNSYVDRETEVIETVDQIEELIENGEKLNEIAVLYRLNSHSSYVENELKKRNIEYDIANDSSFFKRKEVAGLIAYLRLIHNPHDDSAFDQIFKLRSYPLAFFSNQLYDDIKKYSGVHNVSLYEAFLDMKYPKPWQQKNVSEFEDIVDRLRLQKDKGVSVVTLISNIAKSFQIDKYIKDKHSNQEEVDDRLNSIDVLKSFVKGNNLEQFIAYVYSNNSKKKAKKDAVRLMSVHGSKGLEFRTVFLIGVEDEKFPHVRADLMEEARLFYVGITRSKENLVISEIGKDSQFVREYWGKR